VILPGAVGIGKTYIKQALLGRRRSDIIYHTGLFVITELDDNDWNSMLGRRR
jgi:hypothetical protein